MGAFEVFSVEDHSILEVIPLKGMAIKSQAVDENRNRETPWYALFESAA
jgi:hypothetical protein